MLHPVRAQLLACVMNNSFRVERFCQYYTRPALTNVYLRKYRLVAVVNSVSYTEPLRANIRIDSEERRVVGSSLSDKFFS